MFAYSLHGIIYLLFGDISSKSGAMVLSIGCIDVDLNLIYLLSLFLHS